MNSPIKRPAAALLWATWLAAACVTRGDPPQGRQIVVGRDAMPALVLPPTGDGTTRVLVNRPTTNALLGDLSVVSVDGAGSPPVERLLAANVMTGTCYGRPDVCYTRDAQGRLLVEAYDPQRPPTGILLARIDPVTGDRTDLGPADYYQLSPSGARLVVVISGAPPMLYDGDGPGVPLAGLTNAGPFLGEVLYAVTDQKELVRLAPGAPLESIAKAVDDVAPMPMDADQHPLFWIQRGRGMYPTDQALSFLDTVTLEETPCPTGSTRCTISPDGRWLVAQSDVITIVDRIAGTTDVLPTEGIPVLMAAEARPGHDELWLIVRPLLGGIADTWTWIKKPGLPPVQTSDHGFGSVQVADTFPTGPDSTSFTWDGRYWFIGTQLADDTVRFQVGLVDDLNAPRVDVVPPGVRYVETWMLRDNLLVTPVVRTTNDREDVYVVNPATGESRVMGEDGVLMAIGHTRLLVNQHHIQNTGDLTVFDLATGQGTVLAPEFARSAVVEIRDRDTVPPGATVAFQFQARFPSPYDGIWLATVP